MTNVFGQGKSNIRFVGLTPTTIDASLIDNNENALLDYLTFNVDPFGQWEYKKGFDNWMEKLYAKHALGTSYDNITAVVEVQFMKRWDFQNGVEDPFNGNAFNTWMDANESFLTGLTSEKDPLITGNFFSGCVALKRNINTIFSNNTFNSSVTVNGMVLETIYHELGHCWGKETSAGNTSLSNCGFHTSYCTGYNKSNCLWHYCEAINANNLVSWMNTAISNPTYCEGHQQIWMNQLRPIF